MKTFNYLVLALVALATVRQASSQISAERDLPASQLICTVTENGTGPALQPDHVVVVHYVGTLPDGTVFDSTRARNQPYSFLLGRQQVIKGWDEAFPTLHVGDKASLTVPPDLAYGAERRGNIPPNSTLRFDVEVLAMKRQFLHSALRERIDTEGLDSSRTWFAEIKQTGLGDYHADEVKINSLGYQYFWSGKLAEAITVLGWNVELFPNSANAYDSLGEAYAKQGNYALAQRNFSISVALNPKNENAARFLVALDGAIHDTAPLTRLLAKADLEIMLHAAFQSWKNGSPVNIRQLRAQLDLYLKDCDQPETGASYVLQYFYLVEGINLQKAREEWTSFQDNPSPLIRELAQNKMRFAKELETPVTLSFTAIDGREVDLSKLRGKVVLIDFWATWCAPCLEELPNIKNVYSQYHDQGFEIIGVSLDQAGDLPKLKTFLSRENLPWPQHFEGRKHNKGGNTLATRFAITGIPAMLLLDTQGMIVSTNARGLKLEQEVRRLLKR